MKNTVTIDCRTFIENQGQLYIVFSIDIIGKKRGYVGIFLGKTSQENAMWEGLYSVLQMLERSYSSFSINFSFPRILFDVNGKLKPTCLRLLECFNSYNFIQKESTEEGFQDFHKLLKRELLKVGQVYGLKEEELSGRLYSKKNSVNKFKSNLKFEFYKGVCRPHGGVCLDLETTSLIKDYARIIEISAIKFDGDGQVVDEYNTLVNPGINIPKSVRDLTGITNEDVKSSPNSFDAIRKLYLFMKGSPVILGHNIEYDYGILESFCSRFNIPFWKVPLLCTRRLAKEMLIQVDDYRLETLCKFLGVENERPHRAWSDTKATIGVMNQLYKGSLF